MVINFGRGRRAQGKDRGGVRTGGHRDVPGLRARARGGGPARGPRGGVHRRMGRGGRAYVLCFVAAVVLGRVTDRPVPGA
ncbi:hypothetical protein QJS66_15720 [Kocuria rhizophila]|nr:hypothetical protein QJS66_15720 [Kocuria rhizophila]